jgi:hypothetical protein
MTGQFNLTSYDRPIVENDKIRQLGRDKFCAGRVGEIPRDGISVMLTFEGLADGPRPPQRSETVG